MAKIVWRITIGSGFGAIDITDKVLSMNFSFGREKYLDTYSGNFLNLTINNASDYASTISNSSLISVVNMDGASEVGFFHFWLQEINYSDAPGDVGLNTATLICADWLSRAGRVQATSYAIAQNEVYIQCTDFNTGSSGPLPADMDFGFLGTGSSSIGSAITYTGTVSNYINLAVTTERGLLYSYSNYLDMIGRNTVSASTPIFIQLGRTATTTQIGYQSFDRIQNGLQFINNATITSTGVADQNAQNAASIATYSNSFYSSQTVDYNATQANGNANWIANTFSDPASLRFNCSFTDRAQTQDAINDLMFAMFYPAASNRTLTLNYTPPGGIAKAINVVVEGYRFNVTPEQTTIVFDMSPLTYYQFFTLDSDTFGVLGGGDISYNQPEITYDENGWIYNDSNADDTASRLGW